MCRLQSVLFAGCSLCCVRASVCGMCSLQSRTSSLRSEHASLRSRVSLRSLRAFRARRTRFAPRTPGRQRGAECISNMYIYIYMYIYIFIFMHILDVNLFMHALDVQTLYLILYIREEGRAQRRFIRRPVVWPPPLPTNQPYKRSTDRCR